MMWSSGCPAGIPEVGWIFLLPENNNTSLLNEQGKIIFLSRSKGAQLDTGNFSSESWCELSGLDISISEQRVKGWIAKIASVGVTEWFPVFKTLLLI
ncbi:hypothetical protein OGAPHI_000253 [Ogataea philodendri]|uniref:Uncharacterized protein n=1 Tax=Ogataea philodendri TaxID=1378263 RepID=A0A9P8PH43_9ASCO|nr:uncharacterized protein OGAPHI_000253 [Ogataea philodendri]KAH3671550.1 hypothetical protein OGAPHI_000253 [Ogataea philodendri]